MEVKKMEEQDLEQIRILYKELVPDGCSLETLKKNFDRIKDLPEYAILVAKEGDQVLGSAMGIICVALDTPFLVVENVVVDESCRGMGIGRKVFEALDAFALENECGYAMLASSGFRHGAHRFYEAVGFDDDVRGFRKYYGKE